MKKQLIMFGILASISLQAQVLELPTLKSKGIKGKVKTIEWAQFQVVENKGLTLVKMEVETYDDKGRLLSIDTEDYSADLKYKTTYGFRKKGLLEQIKIVNSTNDSTLRTTDYTYKKGVLATTNQIQGVNSTLKNYIFNSNKQLTGVEVLENGALSLAETYEVDAEGRRTKFSRKLPNEEVFKAISTYTYKVDKDNIVTVENRNTDQGAFEITQRKQVSNERVTKETTKKIADGQQGFNSQLYVDDEFNNWVKGEVIDNQFSRSRLVLRKITYFDGKTTGRFVMNFEDDRAKYFRQNSQFQVLLNGRIVTTGAAAYLFGSNDRLVYTASESATILLKGYDANSYQTTWHEAQVLSRSKDEIFWEGKVKGISIYKHGSELTPYSGGFSCYTIGNSSIVYLSEGNENSFIAEHFDTEDNKGKIHKAKLLNDHYYWGKATDSTYMLVGYGQYVSVKKQIEDKGGNKLVMGSSGISWYCMPKFRQGFDQGIVGDIFPARNLNDPLKQIVEEKLFDIDLSSFKHDNLKNGRYRLKSADDQTITSLALPSDRTPDDELVTYFPLTKQYLLMEKYYSQPDDEDVLNQPVTVLMKGHKHGHYIYNDGPKVTFYLRGTEVGTRNFGVHKLFKDEKKYGAVLYDSASALNFKMVYDLGQPDGMGPMTDLPYNQPHAYLLKLENRGWVIFEKGNKVGNYDFSKIDGADVIHFYKDVSNKPQAYRFSAFDKLEVGGFISAKMLEEKEVEALMDKLNVPVSLEIEKKEPLKN